MIQFYLTNLTQECRNLVMKSVFNIALILLIAVLAFISAGCFVMALGVALKIVFMSLWLTLKGLLYLIGSIIFGAITAALLSKTK